MRLSLLAALIAVPSLSAQTPAARPPITQAVRQFVNVDAPTIALRNVKLIDGMGTPAKEGQTIVIQGTQITAVGPTASVRVPEGAQVIDLTGHTVIPGLVGLHDHMYYNSRPQLASYPKLFLATGVTTIRTTGSYDSYQELNLKRTIDEGRAAGPTIYVTGPYLQGAGQGGPGAMHPLSGPDDAKRMVKYWADEGVTWFKAYTFISRAELGAAIEEAHKNGIKVTAHLCSVGFREAVALGIDNLEHGLFVNTEYSQQKQPDRCPSVGNAEYAALDVNGAAVQQTFREMIAKKVAMTSTLAVYENGTPSRVPLDQRVLDAFSPEPRAAAERFWANAQTSNDAPRIAVLKKAMEYERAFVKAGGLLAAGSDPCCTIAIAGYADQRNFVLLVEAGFTTEEAVRIMTWNGATVLGGGDRYGTVQAGRQADLVVLRGDLTQAAANIKNVTNVFRLGVGYDPVKLTDAIKGRIGIF